MITGSALLAKIGAVNAAWKALNGLHKWLCSAAGVLAIAALCEHTTPLGLLHRFGVDVTPLRTYIATDAWQRGLLYGAAAVAVLAMIGVLSAGNESGLCFAELLKRNGEYTVKEHREDRRLVTARDLHNYGWLWLAVLVFVQLGVLTGGSVWLFIAGVVVPRAVVESWRTEPGSRNKWRDRREVFVPSILGALAFGALAALMLPVRLFQLFSYPLSLRRGSDDVVPLKKPPAEAGAA